MAGRRGDRDRHFRRGRASRWPTRRLRVQRQRRAMGGHGSGRAGREFRLPRRRPRGRRRPRPAPRLVGRGNAGSRRPRRGAGRYRSRAAAAVRGPARHRRRTRRGRHHPRPLPRPFRRRGRRCRHLGPARPERRGAADLRSQPPPAPDARRRSHGSPRRLRRGGVASPRRLRKRGRARARDRRRQRARLRHRRRTCAPAAPFVRSRRSAALGLCRARPRLPLPQRRHGPGARRASGGARRPRRRAAARSAGLHGDGQGARRRRMPAILLVAQPARGSGLPPCPPPRRGRRGRANAVPGDRPSPRARGLHARQPARRRHRRRTRLRHRAARLSPATTRQAAIPFPPSPTAPSRKAPTRATAPPSPVPRHGAACRPRPSTAGASGIRLPPRRDG